ncbi:MAG: beta-lactamase family protein [Phycisphaerae bacterium]|nr:beta-lactamase family protein [Gemmatimonadaceae bacterium]
MLLLAALVTLTFAADATAAPRATSAGLPVSAPAAVGMSAERLATIDRVVRRGITAGGFPGAAVVVGRKGYSVWSKGFGSLDWTAGGLPVTSSQSIYDLASLTKVIATTTAIMVLYDEGKVSLDAPVSRYLPTFSGGLKDQVTVKHLLTHRAGLAPGRELWRIARNPDEARAAVLASNIGCQPGKCYEYSDLGADILGFIAEAASGVRLDEFLDERVFSPLGMTDTHFKLSLADAARTAPTEILPPRGYPLRGEVHDENAYALGGIAGHAGLFSTANDLSVFAQMLLNSGTYNGHRIVADSTVALFTRRAETGTRALGWDSCDGNGGCGQYLSARAFGHTGFTGTSIWIDPDRQMFVILLTNRVHAAKAKRPSTVIADVRNDLSDAAALAVMDDPGGPRMMPASFRADKAEDWNRPLRARRATSRSSRSRKAAATKAAAAKAAALKKKKTAAVSTAVKTSTAVKPTALKTTTLRNTPVKTPTPKSSTSRTTAKKKPKPKKS